MKSRSRSTAAAGAGAPAGRTTETPSRRAEPTGAARWISAGASAIHGRGVYARTTIPDGTRVIEYVGERITKAEARRREAARRAELQAGGEGCVTIFNLNQRYDLDGRGEHNVARLINHSCAPNCRAEQVGGRIWIVARRDIPAGEELTFDYGYPLSEWRLHPCRCGAKRCPGYIVGAAQRWRLRQRLRGRGRPAALRRAA